MKRLYCNYAESMSHGLAFIIYFKTVNQLKNAKNIFFTVFNLRYQGIQCNNHCLGCSGLPA